MELQSEMKNLKGIGPKKQAAFDKLKIHSVEDLLFFYPREYEDRSNLKSINTLEAGETALIKGKIQLLLKGKPTFGKKQTLRVLVEDATGAIEVVFFRRAYLVKTLYPGKEYVFYGKVQLHNERLQMIQPEFHIYEGAEENRILPVYPLAFSLKQNELRKWQTIASPLIQQLKEYLPEETLERNRLCNISYALANIHFPETHQKCKEAKFRFIFEELLLLQIGLMLSKNRLTSLQEGICFSSNIDTNEFTEKLPYPLTSAQKRVISEINEDMESKKVMNRLVQGDVGSGKTAVAAAAIFKAVKSGFQAAMMAPTELLAKQHYEGLKREFEPFDIAVGFLSGSLTAKEKKQVLLNLESGKIRLLVGTHAVIQKTVVFNKLGLVITDEQHRFGVSQRNLLIEKGQSPDVLVMTATPIPRTLAIILYGDLDASIIDEMPNGRLPILTKALLPSERESAYAFVRNEIQKGRQGYVVAPLIEDSEFIESKSAVGVFEELRIKFPQFQVALLHGGMKQGEKDAVMEDFYNHKIDLLVATVVIEVGINVPNATVMIIENAERFGLAQLHQLRGRVGRGKQQSYCLLVSEQKSSFAKERAQIMAKTNDGFFIAEKDLQLRGPGEFFGMRQHGMPELKLADLGKHIKILKKVKEESMLLLEEDPLLISDSKKALRNKIEKMFENVGNISI